MLIYVQKKLRIDIKLFLLRDDNKTHFTYEYLHIHIQTQNMFSCIYYN